MNTIRLATTGIVAALTVAGCVTGHVSSQEKGIGKTVTFAATEPAPEQFDAWAFYWQSPSIECFDADLQYVVLLPQGREPYIHDCGMMAAGESVQSAFWDDMPMQDGKPKRDLVRPFRGQKITIIFQPTKGRIRFPVGSECNCVFYRKAEDGRIPWNAPFKQIKVQMK